MARTHRQRAVSSSTSPQSAQVAAVMTPELTDPAQLAELETNSFSAIFSRYSRQRDVQSNDDVPEEDAPTELHLSDFGYAGLPLPTGARFLRLTGPRVRVVDRTASTLENHVVDQLIVHAAGWSYDKPNIEHHRAGSPVESGTGYDPAKVAHLLQQYLRGARQAPHCLISRRGDIYCIVPWSKATALSVPALDLSDIQDRSITVSLEARYTARTVAYAPHRPDLPIAMMEPITAAQVTALSFIARKLMTWAGITELPVIDGTLEDVRPKLGTGGSHAAGMLTYGVFDYAVPDQMVPELLLPTDWVVGAVSTLPERLRRAAVLPAWTSRIEQAYPAFGFSTGNPASMWPRVVAEIAVRPTYSFQTDLFAAAATASVFTAEPPTGIMAASSERANIVTGEGFQRAYDMSSSTRSSLYDAASVALDAVVVSTMEKEARNRSVENGVTHVAITQSALGFDFEDGLWKYADVPVMPAPGSVTIAARTPPTNTTPTPTPATP